MADLIQKTDSLNDGRVKLNEAIKDADTAKVTAKGAEVTAGQARQIAQTAESKANSVQAQFDQVVIEGDSSVEAAQARVDEKGTAHPTLKARLDAEQSEVTRQLAETATKTEVAETSKPIISFIFDDQNAADALTYSIFKEFGLVCGFALIGEKLFASGTNDINNYRKYQNEGFEVLSHSMSHKSPVEWSFGALSKYESEESAKVLRDLGFNIHGWVTPQSAMDVNKVPYLLPDYDYAFTVFDGVLNAEKKGHHKKGVDPYRLHRTSLYSNSEADSKIAIDNCIKENGMLFFYDHGIGYSGSSTEAKLRNILTYLKDKVNSNQCIVANPTNAVRTFLGAYSERPYGKSNPKNLIIDLATIGSTFSLTSWSLSSGATGSVTYENDAVATVSFGSNVPAGTVKNFNVGVDLRNFDLAQVNNRSITFAIDIESPSYYDATLELDMRFLTDLNTNSFTEQIIEPILFYDKKRRYVVTKTIKNITNIKYILVNLSMKTKTHVTNGVYFKFSKPRLFLGTGEPENVQEINAPIYNMLLNLFNATPSANTSELLITSVKNQLMEGLSSGGTFKVKKTGRYAISVNGGLKVTGASGDGNGNLIIAVNDNGIAPSSANSWLSPYFLNGTNDVSAFGINQTVDLKAGDTVYVRLRVPSMSGTYELQTTYLNISLLA